MKEKKYNINYAYALLALLLLTGMSGRAVAQEFKKTSPWYVGLRGGVPFGISTFSSFGADKTHVGIDAGVYGGYRFNPVLSIEASALWGKVGLSDQDCCIDKGYWLGVDGVRYNTSVAGMNGYAYADIKSSVFMQHYGLHLNVNLLGLFASTRQSRWSVSLSPALYAIGTKATLKSISDNAEIGKGSNNWHLGLGGDLMAEYRVTRHLSVGIYSGLTYLTGKQMDGVPEYLHKDNMLWQSGIRIGWQFGKGSKSGKKTATKQQQSVQQSVPQEPQKVKSPIIKEVTPAVKPDVQSDCAEPQTENRAEVNAVQTKTINSVITFPAIYFDFNSLEISNEQLPKVKQIAEILISNPQIKVELKGWCDTSGSHKANAKISLQRAVELRYQLIKHGVAGNRITVKGMGSDTTLSDPAKARRVETTNK
ncbi:OmpA family protein [Bacteroides sp.]|uniref:OmpA family protein n=1 Tax=Bacteroides sp. TaxID=29523 RepID=UPI0026379CD7|nr:OmpA family protein [Bacteroides sp.]MDD3036939.1 OmpA family protein [Bacteroides sp.]